MLNRMPDESLEAREKLLRESVVSLAKGQEFDGALICRLQHDLATLRWENAELRKIIDGTGSSKGHEAESARLRRENARLQTAVQDCLDRETSLLRPIIEQSFRRMCPSRLEILHVGAKHAEFEHCVGRVGHDGQHQTAEGTYF